MKEFQYLCLCLSRLLESTSLHNPLSETFAMCLQHTFPVAQLYLHVLATAHHVIICK